MAVPVNIINGGGDQARVTPEGDFSVSIAPYPPIDRQLTRPFRQFFTLDGTPSGDKDLGQDGSSTPLDFCIPALEEEDLFITHLSFAMGYGTSGSPYQFGDGAALTNGVRLFYTSYKGEVDLQDKIATNEDLMRLSDSQFSTNWEIRGIGGANDYGFFTDIHLLEFAPYFGIKLDKGTNQKMILRIRDTMAAVSGAGDKFDCVAHGFVRF